MKPGLLIPAAAALCAGSLLLAAPAPARAAGAQPKPLKAADLRSTDLTLDGRMTAASTTAAGRARSIEIRTPDAAFIKVHFDKFNLPRGVTLEISNPDRTEVYRYSKDRRDGHTVDATLGHNGRTRFSAMSITGPVAVLRLVGTAQEPWTTAHGVKISKYSEGIPMDLMPQLRQEGLLDVGPTAICGTDDKKAAVCYAGTDAASYDRSRPVARMVTPTGYCTAWRVGPTNRLFTNNHCASTASTIAGSEFWFNYQTTTCGGTTQATVVKVAGDQLLKTHANLDFTLFTVKNFDTIASFGYLGLETREPTMNEEIFIPGHPGGRMKELAVVSDQDGGGRCRVNDTVTTGNGGNVDMGYYCDTEGGNSGSPVIARASNRVIALHHLGGCMNQGARMSLIWPQVSGYFSGVPGGDTGVNAAPVANFSFSVSGRTATFTDASTDSDGSIASRSWAFGDGTTSTVANPSRTYAADGTYEVRLTVTDDKGASHSVAKVVTIGTPVNQLTRDVPVSNLSGAQGSMLRYTMNVPAGATGLKFTTAGGSGDADLYVKFDSEPSTTSHDCKSENSTNAETCSIATAQAGTYHVLVYSYSAFSGMSLTGTYTTGRQTYTNSTDYAIRDNATVESMVAVTGRSGNAHSDTKVAVNIVHSYIGDLKVDLISPDGTVYVLHNRAGGSADNINQTYTVNASSELMNGTWKLRVNDNYTNDTGYINSWSITL